MKDVYDNEDDVETLEPEDHDYLRNWMVRERENENRGFVTAKKERPLTSVRLHRLVS